MQMVSGQASDAADAVYLDSDSANFVQVTGVEPDSLRRESLWWIGDTGVRFGIDVAGQNNATQQALGLKDTTPTRAPWTVIRWLPAGPLLSEQAARVQRDTVINIPGERLQGQGNR